MMNKIYVIVRYSEHVKREFKGITTSYEDAVEFIKRHMRPRFNKGRWDESYTTAPIENSADERWYIRTSDEDSFDICAYNIDENYNIENYTRCYYI